MNRINCLFLAAVTVGSFTRAEAQVVVPPSLEPGDRYYLVFITDDQIAAGSGDIATYNKFVNDEAAKVAALKGISWKAIASTEKVSAKTNVGELGVFLPVFLLDGKTQVLSSASSLFRARGLSSAINLTQSAAKSKSLQAWTGTTPLGASGGKLSLGHLLCIVGRVNGPGPTSPIWIESGVVSVKAELSLYAISEVLTVPEKNNMSVPKK